jgi:hypothetical protein
MRIVLILIAARMLAQPVASDACFAIERLPEAERAAALEVWQKLLDSEGLYTLAGGIKPMSGGYVSFRAAAASLEIPDVDAARRYLALFQCGEMITATVAHFSRPYPNEKTKQLERYYDGVVFHRGALRRAIREHREYFGPLGITEHSEPLEVLLAVEYQEGPARLRGLGILFGYPDYAIEWFVGAAREQGLSGKFVERDFIGAPTFARAERGVVYAVPKGNVERPVDGEFRARLQGALAEYRKRREEFVGEGKAGLVAMLRAWFCEAQRCAVP